MVYGTRVDTNDFFKSQLTNKHESYASYVTESFAVFDVARMGQPEISEYLSKDRPT